LLRVRYAVICRLTWSAMLFSLVVGLLPRQTITR
jgi:hypothetical protein